MNVQHSIFKPGFPLNHRVLFDYENTQSSVLLFIICLNIEVYDTNKHLTHGSAFQDGCKSGRK